MKYNAAFDGVRAVAVIAVVAFHAANPFVGGGFIGVDVFFVLSGYLITSILRNELRSSGAIDLWRFYARRFVRLMPPLVLCMIGAVIGYKIFVPQIDLTADAMFALFYLTDYSIAF